MIDTHAHLYLSEFDNDIQEVIDNAKQTGVKAIILPNIDSTHSASLHRTEQAFPNYCFAAMGLHPCSVKENFETELDHVSQLLLQKKYIAIGECGLDYYWDKTFITQQKEALLTQIQWAKEYQLPIILHTRDSIEDTLTIVEKQKSDNLKGVFHCFSGSVESAQRIIKCGFYMGIGGVSTYKNAGLQQVLPRIGLERIVLETDAPYLSPVPYRGKRNESAYLKNIVNRISEIMQVSEEEVISVTTENAKKLFDI